MPQDLESLTVAWGLRSAAYARLAAAPDPTLSATIEDVDPARRWFFGESTLIEAWLHQPHPALYHQAPLDLIVKSAAPRAALRRMLIAEAALHGSALDRAPVACRLRP